MSNIQLFNQDCMTAMASMKDKEFELAIVDPPYGIGDYKTTSPGGVLLCWNKYKKTDWDDKPPSPKYFNELIRISKNQIIWGCNYFNYYLGSGRVIWDKVNGCSTQSDCEIAYQSFTHSTRMFKYMWYGMLQQNMKQKENRIHPTQKPVALYQWLLKNYAKQGDRILDTHLGSGSSAIAADIMGFDFVGYEIDEDYYKAALDRFNRHKQQCVLEFA
jgi:site-specific DNA-methyltransferase (adenine-specific)